MRFFVKIWGGFGACEKASAPILSNSHFAARGLGNALALAAILYPLPVRFSPRLPASFEAAGGFCMLPCLNMQLVTPIFGAILRIEAVALMPQSVLIFGVTNLSGR